MKNYIVTYELDGAYNTKNIEAPNPGSAFAKTLKLFPGAKLLKCIWQTHLAGAPHMPMVHIDYDPPSVKKVTPMPADPPQEQAAFGFLDKIKPRTRR